MTPAAVRWRQAVQWSCVRLYELHRGCRDWMRTAAGHPCVEAHHPAVLLLPPLARPLFFGTAIHPLLLPRSTGWVPGQLLRLGRGARGVLGGLRLRAQRVWGREAGPAGGGVPSRPHARGSGEPFKKGRVCASFHTEVHFCQSQKREGRVGGWGRLVLVRPCKAPTREGWTATEGSVV